MVSDMARDLMIKEFLTVQTNDTVASIISKLGDHVSVCVFEGKTFVGMFDPHQLLKARVDTHELKVGSALIHVPRLGLQDDHLQIASAFYDSGALLLPVFDKEKVVGVVPISKVLSAISTRLKEVRISDIRHPAPIVVLESERLDTALNFMHEQHIDHLAVLDMEGKMAGVLNYKTLLDGYYIHHQESDMRQRSVSRTRAFKTNPPPIPGLPVADFMTTKFSTIAEDDNAADAAQKMIAEKTMALFILDEGMPTSIVTQKELLEAMIHAEVPENTHIQYVGLEELDIDTYVKMQVKRIVSRHATKLDHYFSNEFQFIVHIKEYSKDGDKHKYSVHLRVAYPGAVVPSSEASAWNVRTAVQEGLKRLESELEHWHKQSQKGKFSVRTATAQGVSAKRERV
jgi:CBS domain-containing protein